MTSEEIERKLRNVECCAGDLGAAISVARIAIAKVDYLPQRLLKMLNTVGGC